MSIQYLKRPILNSTRYYIVQSPQQREETSLLYQLIQHIKDSKLFGWWYLKSWKHGQHNESHPINNKYSYQWGTMYYRPTTFLRADDWRSKSVPSTMSLCGRGTVWVTSCNNKRGWLLNYRISKPIHFTWDSNNRYNPWNLQHSWLKNS